MVDICLTVERSGLARTGRIMSLGTLASSITSRCRASSPTPALVCDCWPPIPRRRFRSFSSQRRKTRACVHACSSRAPWRVRSSHSATRRCSRRSSLTAS